MRGALDRGSARLLSDVRDEVKDTLPSGYAPILADALRIRRRNAQVVGGVRLTLTVFADGQKEQRDLVRINKGVLRHPIPSGRRHAWVNQRVRPGVVDRPAEALSDRVDREMIDVADSIVKDVSGR